MNGKIFLDYIRNILVPTLNKGDIVIMDNLNCHKVKDVAEAIKSAGAYVFYLPPYSPELKILTIGFMNADIINQKWNCCKTS